MGERVAGVTDVSVAFGGVKAVVDVSLRVNEGEILGLIGPNGAGKSTLLNILSGYSHPDSGRIDLLGEDVTDKSVSQRSRRGLSRSFQSTTVFPTLTVEENVELAALTSGGRHFALWRGARERRATADKATAALADTDLERERHMPAAALGHGQARALEVAMLLASGGRVLLLDEPGAGMAAAEVSKLTNTIARSKERSGAAIVLVEHKISVIFGLSDRIAVMDRGALLAVDTPGAIAEHAAVRKAYLGEEVNNV